MPLKYLHLVPLVYVFMKVTIHKIPWLWRFCIALIVSSLLFLMIWIFSKFREPPKFNLFLNALLLGMVFITLEVVRGVQRKMLYKVGQFMVRRQLFVFLWSILLGTLSYTLLFYFFKWIDHFIFYSEPPFRQHLVAAALIGLILSIIFALFFLILHWKDLHYHTYIRNESYKKELTVANLNMLRNQLDPHFMFNNFNTLYYLIDEDPILAKKFLNNISSVYRHVLEHTKGHLIPVAEEFKVILQYLEVLKERYGTGLSLEYQITDQHFIKKSIPPLVLQELIENIFKHNQVSEQHPIHVKLVSSVNGITIYNTVRSKSNAGSNGTGLENITKRYDLLTKNKVVVKESSDSFSVTIPLIPLENAN